MWWMCIKHWLLVMAVIHFEEEMTALLAPHYIAAICFWLIFDFLKAGLAHMLDHLVAPTCSCSLVTVRPTMVSVFTPSPTLHPDWSFSFQGADAGRAQAWTVGWIMAELLLTASLMLLVTPVLYLLYQCLLWKGPVAGVQSSSRSCWINTGMLLPGHEK